MKYAPHTVTIGGERYRLITKNHLLRDVQSLAPFIKSYESNIKGFPATFLFVYKEPVPRYILTPDTSGQLSRYKRLQMEAVQ